MIDFYGISLIQQNRSKMYIIVAWQGLRAEALGRTNIPCNN